MTPPRLFILCDKRFLGGLFAVDQTNKSIRFPNDVIDEIEDAIKGTDCTFSAFVVEAVRVALENLKEDSE